MARAGPASRAEARVGRRQLCIVDTDPLRDARAVVLDENVSRRRQPLEDPHALGTLEIEHEASLVAVDGQERC